METTLDTRTDCPPSREHGFTLIELLVVMIIVGILAAIAIPAFSSQRQRARDTAVKSDMHSLVTELVTAQADAGSYPTAPQLHAAGTDLRTSPTVQESVVWATATDFCVVATSTDSSKDTSGYGGYAGVTTKIFVQSSSSPAEAVVPGHPGCLASATAVPSGWFDSDGYHPGAIGS